jgi:demethylmenaquinone methyltransferase/2-methoxy-6-polyprenyl-1,4-benzoquinol methylase
VTNSKSQVKPFSSDRSKREEVEEMFDNISHKYDFLNHFLSLGIDKLWRKRAIAELKEINPKTVLDVATGTADLALEALTLEPESVIGVDISEKMLDVGRQKIAKRGIERVKLIKGDAVQMEFEDNQFDAITVAFGVRNFDDLSLGLKEMNRVLRPGGKLVILEFVNPVKFPIKQLYTFYSKYILPFWGKLFSGSKEAYVYLPESVKAFKEREELCKELEKCGYSHTKYTDLTFGICGLYTARKA